MGKGGKSSATPATRKKQASKAASKYGNTPPQPLQRGQKRRSKKEKAQQKKKFVPPQKPPQPPPYPLDSMGLASLLPDELVMILRRAVKKDIVTRVRTMESLVAWIDGQVPEAEAMSVSERFDALALAIPCWVYLFPRLAMSRSQRLRLLTLQVLTHLLSMPPPDASSPREELLMPINIEAILGFFAVLAHDTNRHIASMAMSLWNTFVSWGEADGKVDMTDYAGVVVEHLRPLLLSDAPSTNISLVTPVLQVTSSSDVTIDNDTKTRGDGNADESPEALDHRLVAGALGVLSWLISSGYTQGLEEFLESSSVWSALRSTGDGSGVDNPQARAQAWTLLAKASTAVPDVVEAHIGTIIPAAFAGAWAESDALVLRNMLPSFLPILKNHRDSWLDNQESSDDEDDEPHTSPLAGFETWIQTVAPLQPQLCFPAVIIFLSTMPRDLLPKSTVECEDFLAPFVSAADTLIKNGMSSVMSGWGAYASMICECIVFITQALSKESPTEANALAGDHLGRIWHEHVLGQRDDAILPERLWATTAKAVASAINALNTVTNDIWLAERAWDKIKTSISGSIVESSSQLEAVLAAIELWQQATQPLADRVRALCGELLQYTAGALISVQDTQSDGRVVQLSCAITLLLQVAPYAADNTVDQAVMRVIPTLLTERVSPAVVSPLLLAYIHARPENDVWKSVFQAATKLDDTFTAVLDTAAELYQHTRPSDDALALWNSQAGAAVREYGKSQGPVPPAVSRLLASPFANEDVKEQAFSLLVERLDTTNKGLTGAMQALANWYDHDPNERTQRLCTDESMARALRSVYTAAFLLPENNESGVARALWKRIVENAGQSLVPSLETHSFAALEAQLWSNTGDVGRVLAAARAIPRAPGISSVVHTLRVLPDAERMDAALLVAASAAPDSLLCISDPLVGLARGSRGDPGDVAPLVRGIDAISVAVETDVSLVSELLPMLPHVIFAAMSLEDALLTGDTELAHALAGSRAPQDVFVRLVQLATRLLSRTSASLAGDWHEKSVQALLGRAEAPSDPLYACITSLWQHGAESAQHARVLSRLLHGILGVSAALEADGEVWMRAALGKSTPTLLAGAILLATRDTARNSRTYDRVRNELVADLGGVRPESAETDGNRLLILLQCAAPPDEWGMALVPMQRAVVALQGIHKWLASDVELGDELFARLAALFTSLAPVVQTATGRVLELMLDTAEENLAAVQLEDHSSWPTLFYTLKLINTLYALDSDGVREVLSQRRNALDEGVRNVFVALARTCSVDRLSEPQHATIKLAVALAEELPASNFSSDEHYDALQHALVSPCASQVLHAALYRRVSQIVQEMVREKVVGLAVAPEETTTELSPVLLSHVARTPAPDSTIWDIEGHIPGEQFAFMLTWLALLDHFDEASLSLRAAFAQQLQAHSAPLLVGLFRIISGDRAVRPLDASRIAIDQVDYAELNLSHPRALQALSAHVYLRMLEHMATQVRDWWLSERDRQLSLYIGTFTTKHCSPLLAARELEHLKAPDALSQLQDDAMSVKVLSSNEVVATYTIDEYPMEIGVRIPPDFPLHGIEIRDIKRIGVSEAQWRAWLLAVQQLLSGKNGLVLDALMLFKHNVESKFQGYEGAECAICYSIISPTDHTLPNKPCRTCRKRFHGSCLFKWVSTSGASTCPLCRSIL